MVEKSPQVVYESTKKKRSIFEVGREVKKAMNALEENNSAPSQEQRRIFIRHEVAHHIPVIKRPVRVTAFIGKEPDQIIERNYIAVTHYGKTDEETLISSLYPLRDKKLWKMRTLLSRGDVKVAIESFWGILKKRVQKTKS